MKALNDNTPIFVLSCIDKRFSNLINKYLNARFPPIDSFTNFFYCTAAGAALPIAYNGYRKNNGLKCDCCKQKSMKAIRRSILENISISQTLYNVNTLYILNHEECAAVRVFLECPKTNNSCNVKYKYPIEHGFQSNFVSDSRNPMVSSTLQSNCDFFKGLKGQDYFECLNKCEGLGLNVSNSSINNSKFNNLSNLRIKEILVEINTHQKLLREALIYIKKRNKDITNVILGVIDKDGTVADYDPEINEWKIRYVSPKQNPNPNQTGLWWAFT
jgi:hypothetical protein